MHQIRRWKRVLWGLALLFWVSVCISAPAIAGALETRLLQFPDWRSLPDLPTAQADLYYPQWMAGEWQVDSILTEAVSPLAPEIVSPGFAAISAQLHQPVHFRVRFQPAVVSGVERGLWVPQSVGQKQRLVADRVYNGMNLAEAELGKGVIESIRLDPRSPNAQVVRFADGQTLATQISNRATETPSADVFISSELYRQTFRNAVQIYLNQVENTIAYRRIVSDQPDSLAQPHIEAEQITAIYLSPQDPAYFKAQGRPVALYRYRLRLEAVEAFGADTPRSEKSEKFGTIERQ
ncbi:MAG TPA: hypothetical protein V6D19_16165 [Stenomitos sp.]